MPVTREAAVSGIGFKARVYLAQLLVVGLTLVAIAAMRVAPYLLLTAPSSSPVTTPLVHALPLDVRAGLTATVSY